MRRSVFACVLEILSSVLAQTFGRAPSVGVSVLTEKLPKVKKKHLSLSLRDIGNLSGDCFQFVTQEDEKDLQKEFIPGNTQRATLWAMKVFGDWKKARKDAHKEACPDYLLERADPADLVRWISLFAAETRNSQGEHYHPSSISNL